LKVSRQLNYDCSDDEVKLFNPPGVAQPNLRRGPPDAAIKRADGRAGAARPDGSTSASRGAGGSAGRAGGGERVVQNNHSEASFRRSVYRAEDSARAGVRAIG